MMDSIAVVISVVLIAIVGCALIYERVKKNIEEHESPPTSWAAEVIATDQAKKLAAESAAARLLEQKRSSELAARKAADDQRRTAKAAAELARREMHDLLAEYNSAPGVAPPPPAGNVKNGAGWFFKTSEGHHAWLAGVANADQTALDWQIGRCIYTFMDNDKGGWISRTDTEWCYISRRQVLRALRKLSEGKTSFNFIALIAGVNKFESHRVEKRER